LTTTFDDQEYWKATEEAGPESVHLIHMRNSRMNCHNIEEEDTYIQYSKLLIKYHGISQETTPTLHTQNAGVYKIHCSCGKVYFWQTTQHTSIRISKYAGDTEQVKPNTNSHSIFHRLNTVLTLIKQFTTIKGKRKATKSIQYKKYQ
jgi:hypothetical protein